MALLLRPFLQRSNVAWRQLFTSRVENPKWLTWNWRSVSKSPYAHRLIGISGIPDPDSAKGADALGFLPVHCVVCRECRVPYRVGIGQILVHWEQWGGLDHRRVGPAR